MDIIDMTAKEFFNGLFNLDFMTEEEKQTIYDGAELFAKGKVHQASLQTPSNEKYLKWVKASERLPKEHKTYFVIKLDGTKDVGFYCDPDMFYSGKKRTWMMNHCVNDNVEAWLEESTPIPILTPCGWVKVEDGLPESVIDNYIVCLQNGTVFEMNYSSLSKRWWKVGVGDEDSHNRVTHWVPLPTKPENI